MPLLYLIAIKCRIHRIRGQGVKLLESSSHREGMWDAKTIACVARKFIAAEGGDLYSDIVEGDVPMPYDFVEAEVSDSLPLPDSCRLREVEVVLLGAPMETINVFCKRLKDGNWHRVMLSEYHIPSQCWKDA